MTQHSDPGLFSSLKALLADLLEVGRTRLALLANEVEEEKLRLGQTLLFGILAIAALVVGLVLLVGFLALLFWENRLWVVGFAALVCLVAAYGLARRSQAELQAGSRLFTASMQELEADLNALRTQPAGQGDAGTRHESTSA